LNSLSYKSDTYIYSRYGFIYFNLDYVLSCLQKSRIIFYISYIFEISFANSVIAYAIKTNSSSDSSKTILFSISLLFLNVASVWIEGER